MKTFAETAQKIANTTKKLEKVAILAEYLAGLPENELPSAAIFFTGMPFAEREQRQLGLGGRAVLDALELTSGITDPEAYRWAYQRSADLGDTAAIILEGTTQSTGLTVSNTRSLFLEVAAARGNKAKTQLFAAFLKRCSPQEARFVVKLVTGELRIGSIAGLVEESVARAFGADLEEVRWANMLTGDIGEVALHARRGTLDQVQLHLFHPLKCMLASPAATAQEVVERMGGELWVEDKFDGVRAQVHKAGNRVAIFSRDLKDFTKHFPEIAQAAEEISGDFILDGELLGYRDGRALPFFQLQQRLGRINLTPRIVESVPLYFVAFDVLYLNGELLLRRPLRERRRLLESLPFSSRFLASPLRRVAGTAALEQEFSIARDRGNEGLMIKDPESIYSPGRRGFGWLKYKKALEPLDVVIVGVEWGHGKRHRVLSDYTFAVRDEPTGELVTLGKAYSGLTDEEIARFTTYFLEHTIREYGRFRLVEPTVVIEVNYESIQKSNRHKSGYALRFPRIARLRFGEKSVTEINTLQDVERLYQRYHSGHPSLRFG